MSLLENNDYCLCVPFFDDRYKLALMASSVKNNSVAGYFDSFITVLKARQPMRFFLFFQEA